MIKQLTRVSCLFQTLSFEQLENTPIWQSFVRPRKLQNIQEGCRVQTTLDFGSVYIAELPNWNGVGMQFFWPNIYWASWDYIMLGLLC